MQTGGLTQTQIRRLAQLNRQLGRAVAKEWDDDADIIRAEIDAIMRNAEADPLTPEQAEAIIGTLRLADYPVNAAIYNLQDAPPAVHLYAVASGNGNDGVSHSFPLYYVRTADPWRLARLALITDFSAANREFVRENMMVDGEAEYTIRASLSEGPDGETEMGAAVAIIEVFRDDGPDMSDPYHKPVYDNLADCFGDDVALVPKH